MFDFNHFSGVNNRVSISTKKAADLMCVSLRTAKRYAADPASADPCRMAYLEAACCRRIAPAAFGIWFDGGKIHTRTGYNLAPAELDAYGWLRSTYSKQQRDHATLKNQLHLLDADNARLRAILDDLQAQSRPGDHKIIDFACYRRPTK